MLWYLFIILGIIASFFFVIGYSTKTRVWVQLGALFLIFIGITILTSGIDIPSGVLFGSV